MESEQYQVLNRFNDNFVFGEMTQDELRDINELLRDEFEARLVFVPDSIDEFEWWLIQEAP